MNKFKITVEYDGSNFVGWQKQENGKSIQESVEKALLKLTGEKVTLFGAGRTDAGVHALGQVAHFEIQKKFNIDNIRDGLNQYLRSLPISILETEQVENTFHARFSANERIYEYIITNRRAPLTLEINKSWAIYKKLNLKKMNFV